jgi:soluble lytic murein transglycosylase-like protein
MVRGALIAALLCVLTPSLAHAQLYSWKDPSGRLIISDRPQDPAAKTLAIAYVGSGYGVTRPAAAATPTGTSGILTRRATQYDDLIAEHANRHDLSPDFVRAVIQAESAFNPYARSPKGAMGLMQLMPATARRFGVIDPFNPAENIRAGVSYLRQLLERYDQDEQLALAAYNAGPAAVDKYGSKVPPYKETQNYVLKITNIRGNMRGGPGARIYRITEIVDGRPVIKYTNTKPASGDFVEVRR